MQRMQLHEAFHELGLTGGETPEIIRRSYMRLLKQRKPEVDPEGFRRLREAYERVVASGPARSVGVEPVRLPAVPVAEVASPEPEHVTAPPEPRGPTAEEWFARIELLGNSDLDGQVGLFREAISALPEDGRLRSRLVWTLFEAGRTEEALAEARAALASGFPGAVLTLCEHAPYAVTEAELASAGPQVAWSALDLLLRIPDVSPAVLAASAGQALLAPPSEWPSPAEVANVSFALQDRGLVKEPITAVATVGRWLAETGQIPEDKARWMVAAELAGLPEHFPEEPRRVIAGALLNAQFFTVETGLREFRRHKPYEAIRARDLLRRQAPILEGLVGRQIDGADRHNGPVPGPTPQRGWRFTSMFHHHYLDALAEGSASRWCSKCAREVDMAIHVRQRRALWAKQATRVGHVLVCPFCGLSGREASLGSRRWFVARHGLLAITLAVIGLGIFAALLALVLSGESDSPVALLGGLFLGTPFLLMAYASFRRARVALDRRAPIPVRFDPKFWKPF